MADITTNKEEETTNNTNRNTNKEDNIDSFVNIRAIRGKNIEEETTNKDTNIIYKEECYKIYHCIYKVHNTLGKGFLESVYQEALEIELTKENIPFESQKMIHIYYDDKPLNQFFKADIVCYDKILLELKSVVKINNEHKAQLMNYLTATKIKLGLLINFGTYPKVEICRIVL
jgi:GxxExxY protein